MIKMKQQCQYKHTHKARNHTGDHSKHDRLGMFFQKFHLLVEWDRQADRCRRQKIAQIFCSRVITLVRNIKRGQKNDHRNDRN